MTADPLATIPRPRHRPPSPRGLSPEQARQLIAAVPAGPAQEKYRAWLLVALLTGLRFSELRQLAPRALERQGERIFYQVRVKGGALRRRELPAAAAAALAALPTSGPFFPMSRPVVSRALRRMCRRAGLPLISPHGLRHSAARLRRETGASLEDVQAFLGHRSIATTARYLTRLCGAEDPGGDAAARALERNDA